jgi:hypothetical protein
VGGYLLGVNSERKLVMELQCNMALRWFVGLNLDVDAWDASTFSQNRRRRFDESGVLEKLFDAIIRQAMAAGLVSRHVSADGTLVRANASDKSFLPIEVALDPEEYKRRLRRQDGTDDGDPQDPGNRAVNFRGEQRSNATHRSGTDPDCRFVSKGSSGTGAYPGYTVNAVMENRHRFLLGLGVEIFQGVTSEKRGCLALLDRARRRLRFTPTTLGADRGFFHEDFIKAVLTRDIEPHIAVEPRAGVLQPMRECACGRGASAISSRSDAASSSMAGGSLAERCQAHQYSPAGHGFLMPAGRFSVSGAPQTLRRAEPASSWSTVRSGGPNSTSLHSKARHH